jgi:ribosomal protein S18 acetylase RimI-like enzyme
VRLLRRDALDRGAGRLEQLLDGDRGALGDGSCNRTAVPPRLRPVTGDDRAFLLELYASTREPALAQVPGLIEQQFDAQDAHYRRGYPGAALDVVEVEGERAGRLYVHRSESEIRIMDIALMPAFRGRGIGTALLRSLIAEAEASGRTLSVHVEAANPARSLYGRLGFRAVGERGGVYVRMERRR